MTTAKPATEATDDVAQLIADLQEQATEAGLYTRSLMLRAAAALTAGKAVPGEEELLRALAKIADDYDAADQRRERFSRDEGRGHKPHDDHHRVSISLGECRKARALLSQPASKPGEERAAALEEAARLAERFGHPDDISISRKEIAAAVRALLSQRPGQEAAHHKLDNDRQVFFYEQEFYVLSNFSAFELRWDGLRFATSEAAYHYEKFERGRAVRQDIRLAPSAHEAFKIAERNKHLRHHNWDQVKVGVMRDILRAKAGQHEYVRRKLLETGDRELIEDSWRDGFWGWGPNRTGQNMLGKLWMEVRSELRASLPAPEEKP